MGGCVPPTSRPWVTCISSLRAKGLSKKPLAPASKKRSLSFMLTFAVNPSTGVWHAGAGKSDRMRWQASMPEVYDTERHLLYVACTRARDRLLMSSVSPASEFVAHMLA